MRRREFMTLLGGAAASPLAAVPEARAQNTPRVGWMFPGISAGNPTELAGFREGLRELSYVEGKNNQIVSGSARLPSVRSPPSSESASTYFSAKTSQVT